MFEKNKNIYGMVQYFVSRGRIFLTLERYEDSYLSFAKALSMPIMQHDENPRSALVEAF